MRKPSTCPLRAYFNPRSPCGLRPLARTAPALCCEYFNPRSPCGLRPDSKKPCTGQKNFNPRSPCGLRLIFYHISAAGDRFQSTQPMRAATDTLTARLGQIKISIHAAHAGCDYLPINSDACPLLFQSTQPMRAATFSALSFKPS